MGGSANRCQSVYIPCSEFAMVDAIEEKLKSEGKSMSSLIRELLHKYAENNGLKTETKEPATTAG